MSNIISFIFKRLYKISLIFKPLIVKFISPDFRKKIKKGVLNRAFPIDKEKIKSGEPWEFKGVNLVGFARAEMGIGESCRIAAKSMTAVEIPFVILNFKGTNPASMKDETWIHKEVTEPQYNVNVFHINAEQMQEIYTEFGSSIFKERYNIGFWHWELPDFPDEWYESFNLVDEIWVPSVFVADAISLKSPVPVVRIPHSIEVVVDHKRERSYYGIPEDTFLFLTMYDLKSYQDRKNPQASIEAFKRTFSPDDYNVGLVIKINGNYQADPEIELITKLVGDFKNIYIISETLSRNDTNALINVTDCFISLHRSEGFGLGLAEAMYLGKPAIGTNWSSTTDFMNHENSCPVKYKLVQIGKDHGPYKAYQMWADPDVDHAGEYMYKLVHDKEYYVNIANSGQKFIKDFYSPKAVGELIQKRLKYINY
ncbi:glycosyltransferase [Paenibacillus sp. NPDC058177]|uniref:glycosyltransferase n=1 Tax=Paenibacillus sp. NPDC058177 TaxID=3346369 RepID=UPI0036DDE4D0